MKHTIQAIEFLARLSVGHKNPAPPKTNHITLENGHKIPYHYYPSQKGNKSKAQTVIFLHGMNYDGHNEPRIIHLCQSLAKSGLNVVSPHIKSISEFWVNFNVVNEIRDLIKTLCKNKKLIPDQKTGLISISLTGTACINAASDLETAEHLSSILVFGSFSNTNIFIPHILSNNCKMAYPKLIILKNIINLSENKDDRIVNALHYAINDNYIQMALKQDSSECNDYLNSLNDQQLTKNVNYMVENILDSEGYIQKYARELKLIDDQFQQFQLPANPNLPIFLIHGEDDNTIPCAESENLKQRLVTQGTPCESLITPLIESHSHFSASLKTVTEFWKLSKSISRYFSA